MIKWGFWKKDKDDEVVEKHTEKPAVQSIFDPNFKKFVPPLPEIQLSDDLRVRGYVASGGEIVDLSNKDRIPNDGFPPDSELLQPFNQAHKGTREGLITLGREDE